MPNNALTKIESAVDGRGLPLGVTLDPRLSGDSVAGIATAYQFSSGTLTAGSPTIVFNFGTDLGRAASKMAIVNVSATASTNFTAAFSYDGTNYGDEIIVPTNFAWDLNYFITYFYCRLTRVSADSSYYVLVV